MAARDQITPRALLDATTDPDRAAAKRAFEAMMKMKKMDMPRSKGHGAAPLAAVPRHGGRGWSVHAWDWACGST